MPGREIKTVRVEEALVAPIAGHRQPHNYNSTLQYGTGPLTRLSKAEWTNQ